MSWGVDDLCDHRILAESIIYHNGEMSGYCKSCGLRVVFPPDPFIVGSRMVLTGVIQQLASNRMPDLEVLGEIREYVDRIFDQAKDLKELLSLIETMYGNFLNGEEMEHHVS